MKKSHVWLLAAAAVVIGAVIWRESMAQSNVPAAPAATRVGVCDIEQIFRNYQRAKDLLAEMNKKNEDIKNEDEKRSKAVMALQAEVEGLLKNSKEREKRESELQMKAIEQKNWREFQETLTMREYVRLQMELYDDIVKTIGETAKENGVQMVLYQDRGEMTMDYNEPNVMKAVRNSIQTRKVLYSDPSLDLTDRVLLKLNDKYKAGRK